MNPRERAPVRRSAPRYVPPVPRQPMGRNFFIMLGIHVAIIAAAAVALKNHADAPEISGGGSQGGAAAAQEVRWVNPQLERPQAVPESPATAVLPKKEAESDIVYTNAKVEPAPAPVVPLPEPPKPAPKSPEPKPAPKPVIAAVPKPKPAPAPEPEVKLRPVEKKPEAPKLKPVETPKVAMKPAPAPKLTPVSPSNTPALRAKPIENTATASTAGNSGSPAPSLRAVPISTGSGQGNAGTGSGNGMGSGHGVGNGVGNGVGSNGRRSFGDIGEYHTRVYEAFHEEWLPPGAIITAGKTYRVKTEIVIARDGKILEANIVQSSGHPDLDQSVQQALRRVVKIEPLPEFIQGSSYRVILNFDL